MEDVIEIVRVNGIEYGQKKFRAKVVKRNDGNEYIQEMLGFKKINRLNGVATLIVDRPSSMGY